MTSMPSYLNKLSIVKQVPIFQHLNFFEQNRIARKAKIVDYKKGDLICKQGAPADAFYCLISGRVYCYTLFPRGDKENVEFIHRGMHFGILSSLTGENHSHNFEAINDSVILQIERSDFADILKATPRLGLSISQNLSQRIRSQVNQEKNNIRSMILSVYSPIKGTGSSTYAANLALSLQRETDKKVLLVSLESKGSHSAGANLNTRDAAPHWKSSGVNIQNIVDDQQKIINSITQGDLPIDFLNAFIDSGDKTLVSKISRFVSAPVNDYNYIIVDLPNEMDDSVLMTLTQSDHVHLVVADRDKDLEMTRQVIDRLNENLKGNFKTELVSVILSRADEKESRPLDEVRGVLNYDILSVLPYITHAELNTAVVGKGMTIITPDAKSEYARTVVRIARQVSGVLVGLVLGGGAALGMAHVGVIRVLERENIPIDIVVGSSMGALIGSLWTMGKTADELEFIANEFKKMSSLFKLVDPPILPIVSVLFVSFVLFQFGSGFTKGIVFILTILILAGLSAAFSGLVQGRKINSWLRSKLGKAMFSDTKIPFRAVAYDLVHREELVIDRGSLVDAVTQSIAIPGVIQPIQNSQQVIIDGGVLNPLPTNVLRRMGITKIIAINVLQSPAHVAQGNENDLKQLQLEAKIPFHVDPLRFIQFRIHKSVTAMFTPNISDIIVQTLQATEYLIAEQSSKEANVVIHPNLVGIKWFELYKVDELIRLGEEAAMQQLDAIKRLVKE